MPAQSNLIYAMKVSDIPEAERMALIEAFEEDTEWGPTLSKNGWEALLLEARQKGLIAYSTTKRGRVLSPRIPDFEVFMEGEWDETWDDAWFGVAITSRYFPTLADDSPHGGLTVFRLQEPRLNALMEMASTLIRSCAPSWFKGEWIIKERWY